MLLWPGTTALPVGVMAPSASPLSRVDMMLSRSCAWEGGACLNVCTFCKGGFLYKAVLTLF